MPISETLHRKIDRCVMCGLCAPRCPAYALAGTESESPRGRLALIDAWNAGRLDLDATLLGHLDHCLGCRACERACPSGVPFGEIMDEARALMSPRRPVDMRKGLGHALLSHRGLLQGAFDLLRQTQRLGLAPTSAPPVPPRPRWRRHYPATGGTRRGEVALFLGCVNERLGQDALRAAITLLNALGFAVRLPPGQTCCGALHRHDGDTRRARALARRNLAAFGEQGIPILHTASGCTAMLGEYPALLGEAGRGFSERVQDINQFLVSQPWPDEPILRPLHKRVAVHTPCSLVNVLRQAEAPFALLRRIPGLEPIALPGEGLCCGGAGSYMLSQPEWAARLREARLQALQKSGAEILLTSNIGCALHLASGLRRQGREIEVLHPVTLLARQLDAQGA